MFEKVWRHIEAGIFVSLGIMAIYLDLPAAGYVLTLALIAAVMCIWLAYND